MKAETIANELQTIVLADDSGLCVDALDGQPGVYSARFAGEPKSDAANNAKLLSELGGLVGEERSGSFHLLLSVSCTIVNPRCGSSRMPRSNPRLYQLGSSGFGYDPFIHYS